MRSGFVGNYVVASDGSLVDVFVTLLLERPIFGRLAGNKRLEFSRRTWHALRLTYLSQYH